MWTKEKQDAYNIEYRRKNKEKIKSIQDAYYEKNKEKRKKAAKEWTMRNRDRVILRRRDLMKSPKGRLKSIKSSAKTRKIDFFLSDDQAISIMTNGCYYCGNAESIGIDRIDSSRGYLESNCVACCSMCNYMKKDFLQIDFINQCKKISLHAQKYIGSAKSA